MIITDDNGLAVFDLIRRTNGRGRHAVRVAFDLIELEGNDLRRTPIEDRSAHWRGLSARSVPASCSMSITSAMATSFSSTPVNLAARGSYRNGLARRIGRVVRAVGSGSRTERASREARGRRGLGETLAITSEA
jgi:hypothetical protein